MLSFSYPNLLFPLSDNIFKVKKPLINIDNCKISSKSSTEHCNFKIFPKLRNVLQNVLFFFTTLSLQNFLYYPKFFELD